jgi:hypothetical protein
MDNAKPLIIIGYDNLKLTTPRQVVEGSGGGIIATKCLLGWGIGGDTRLKGRVDRNDIYHVCEGSDDYLHQLVKDNFSTEAFGVKVGHDRPQSQEDVRAAKILETTTKRIGERFETGLLWRTEDNNAR